MLTKYSDVITETKALVLKRHKHKKRLGYVFCCEEKLWFR